MQATLKLNYQDELGGFVASTEVVEQTITKVEHRIQSVANYANDETQLGMLNISDGSLSVFRNGVKEIFYIDLFNSKQLKEIDVLLKYARRKVEELGKEIAEGNISMNPKVFKNKGESK